MTPLIGCGLAVVQGNGFLMRSASKSVLMGFLVALLIAMLMGLVDDLRNIKARWKIVFQLLAGMIAYYGGFRIDAISSPFGSSIELGLASFPATRLRE